MTDTVPHLPAALATRAPEHADDIALRGVRVTTRLAAMGERTRIELTFANRGTGPIEPIYTFPLPDGAAVVGFEVETNERVLRGEIDAAVAAERRYEEAVERGDGAFLLEAERDDVFTVRVGSLRAGQLATVRLDYVRALDFVDRELRFELPVTLGPRYADGSGMDPCDAALEADAVNPPKSFAVPYGLTFTCDVELGRTVVITSPSHALHVAPLDGSPDRHAQRVTLATDAIRPDRAIVLALAVAGDDAPVITAGAGPDGARYLAVSFVPEPDADGGAATPAQEVVFLVDCSGSMEGESIAQARRALELCLRSLRHGDRFQVVRFGSSYVPLFRTPESYSRASCQRALATVAGMQADLGGTEARGALEFVFRTPPHEPGAVRTVLLLTDGQVSNEDATIALARDHAATHRLFTFGIGPAVSQTLVRGLARVTGGAAEFVTYGERIEDKVLRTFSRIESPAWHDVRVDWEGPGADAVELPDQQALPPLFDGDTLTLRARCDGELPRAVVIRGRVGGRERAIRCDLDAAVPEAGEAPLAAILWARERITALTDRVRGTAITSRFHRNREASREHRIEELGRRFGLVTAHTAFVAVEHRSAAERERGEPALQRIPVQMPVGWGGAADAEHDAMMMLGGPATCAAPAPTPKRRARLTAPRPGAVADGIAKLFGQKRRECESAPPAQSAADAVSEAHDPGSGDPLLDLLGRQTPDGDFEGLDDLPWSTMFAGAGSLADLRRLATAAAAPVDTRGIDTLVALAILDTQFHDRRQMFRRAAAKARAWLAAERGFDDARIDAALQHIRSVT